MTSLQPRSSRSNAPDRPVASSSSTSPRVFPSTASVASIPIPHANREPSPYPSQSLRSPSSSSFPYRPHLYSRQPSNPQQPPPVPPPPPSEPINLPRIHLPRPNSAARLTVGVGGDTPPLSSRALDSPSWCGESSRNAPPPGVYRTLSDSARGLNLPPLQFTSSSGAAPSQPRNPPARMPPPPLSPGRGTSSQVSPRIYNPPPPSALRPTYAGYEPPQTGRWKDDPYELRSPPLRGLPRSYSPERYAPPHYYAPPQASSSRARTGRSRSQSTASRRSEEAVESVSREVGAGPNRRMAHLMSEQKRREYVITPQQCLHLS